MPTCQNCESFVTERYVRVNARDEDQGPRVCPWCEDKVRDKTGRPRDARSTRRRRGPVVTDGGEDSAE